MNQTKLLRNTTYLLSMTFFVLQANAASIIGSGNSFGSGLGQTISQDMYKYKKLNDDKSKLNSLVHQPKISEPNIAGINSSSSENNNGVVYVLKKHVEDKLGGSLHQNKTLKQYLGINY